MQKYNRRLCKCFFHVSFASIYVPGDLFGNGMLNLQPSVDLDEVEIAGLVGQKFHGTSVRVTNVLCQSYSVFCHLSPNLGI